MRFQKIQIRNAGPLSSKTIEFKDVNLIIGNNEEGKTTLVDILIHHLLGKKKPANKSVWSDRFDFSDAIIETDGDSIPDEMREFSSLFIIREGENLWHGKTNKPDLLSPEIWNHDIKEILYGSDSAYTNISKELTKCLGITKSDSWLNAFHKNLLSFDSVIQNQIVEVNRLKNNEAAMDRHQKRLIQLEKEISAMTEARKDSASKSDIELIQKYFSLLDDMNLIQNQIDQLESKKLQTVQSEWDKIKKEAARLEKEIEKVKTDGNSISRINADRTRQIDELKAEKETLSENQRKNHMETTRLSTQKEVKEKAFAERTEQQNKIIMQKSKSTQISGLALVILSAVFGIAGALGQTGILQYPLPLWIVWIAVLCSASGGLVLLNRAKISSMGLNSAGLAADNDWKQALKELDFAIGQLKKQTDFLESQIQNNLDKTKKLQEQILASEKQDVDQTKQRLENELRGYKDKDIEFTKIYHSLDLIIQDQESLRNLKNNYTRYQNERNQIKQKLLLRFKTDSQAQLKLELEKLASSGKDESADGIQYNESVFSQYTAEKDELTRQTASYRLENEKINGEVSTRIFEGVKNLTSKINPEYLDLFYSEIRSLSLTHDIFNIYAFNDRFQKFLAKVNRDIEDSHKLQAVFLGIQARMDTLLGNVFHTQFFRDALKKITNGRYTDTQFETDDQNLTLMLIDNKGGLFDFNTLSTGARNQLYFAVRLALARSRFSQQRGVFILDDAFITFDSGRRKSSLELLKTYAEDGWQIIYSTVNENSMEKAFDEVFGKQLQKVVL